MDQASPQYCRLCLIDNANVLNIYTEYEPSRSVAMIIQQHFWFEIKPDDQYSKNVCVDCWNKVQDFHLFYSQIYVGHSEFYSQFENIIVKQECGKSANDSVNLTNMVDSIETELFDEFEPKPSLKKELAENEIYENGDDDSNDQDDSEVRTSDEGSDESDSNSDDDNDRSKKSEYSRAGKRKKLRKLKTQEKLVRVERENQQIREYFSMICELCPAQFQVFQEIKTHYRVAHKQKGYLKCCSKKLVQRCHVLDHIQRHLNPDTFKCEQCNKCYADKRGLQNHMHFHLPSEQKAFKCPHCPKTYAKNFLLRQHLQRHITDREKPFFCGECGKSFASKYVLQAHKRGVHEGAFVHVCEICAKSFKSKLFYEHHIKAMHSETPLPKQQCQLCGAWLKHENSLRRHMKRHEDAQKEHICQICGKQSPNRGALRSHQKYVHMVERTHKCSVCDKAFKKAVTLKEHMTMHTGEILYTCPHCPKTFNSSANMHSHRKKMHPREFEETRRQRMCYNENL